MPCRHSRSATGCGPGAFSGQGGSSGSITAHNSSSTIHGRVLTTFRTAESSHRSRPTRTLQQDRVTSSKGEAPYFAVFEGDFPDAAAIAAARASPQGQRIAADVANYATGGAVIIHYPVQDGTG